MSKEKEEVLAPLISQNNITKHDLIRLELIAHVQVLSTACRQRVDGVSLQRALQHSGGAPSCPKAHLIFPTWPI